MPSEVAHDDDSRQHSIPPLQSPPRTETQGREQEIITLVNGVTVMPVTESKLGEDLVTVLWDRQTRKETLLAERAILRLRHFVGDFARGTSGGGWGLLPRRGRYLLVGGIVVLAVLAVYVGFRKTLYWWGS